MTRQRFLRWLGRAAIAVGIVATLAAAGAFALLRTDAGRALVAGAIEDAVRTPGELELEIGRLDGALPGEIVLADVRLRDRDGEWLAIDRARLDWRPWALTGRRVVVESLDVDGLRVARAPASDAETDTAALPRDLSLPTLPFDVRLGAFDFRNVELGAALLGEAMTLQATGRFGADTAGDVRGRVRVERMDGAAAEIALDAVLEAATKTLDIDLRVAEPAGGMVARLAGLPDLPAVSVSLKGRGPASGWTGRLTAEAHDLASLGADVTIRFGDGTAPSLGVSGSADVARLLDADAQALLGPVPQFELQAKLGEADEIVVERARLAGAAVEASLQGSVDLAAQRADLGVTADLLDPSILDRFADGVTLRGARLNATARGPFDGLAIDATATATGLAAEGVTADEAEARIVATVAPQRVVGRVTGRLAGLAGGADLPPLPARLDVDAKFAADLAKQAVALSDLRATGEGLDVTGSAEVGLESGAIAVDLVAKVDRLAPYAAFAGLDLDGRAESTIRLASDDLGGTSRGTATIELAALKSTELPLGPAVGDTATFDAKIAALSATGVELSEFSLRGANLDLTGRATVSQDWQTLDASARLGTHDLAPWQAFAGVPLQGRTSGTISATGPLADPQVRATFDLAALSAAGAGPFDGTLKASARTLATAPTGDIALAFTGPYGPLDVTTNFAMPDGDRLALDGVRLDGLGAQASGNVELDLATGLASGDLDIRAEDLAPAARFAGVVLAGSATARVKLTTADGAQGATVRFDVPMLTLVQPDGDDVVLQKLAGDATLARLEPVPAGRATLTLGSGTMGDMRLDGLTANLSGTADKADFDIAAKGETIAPFDLAATGSATLNGTGWMVALDRFDGTLADRAIALAAPTRLAAGADGMSLSPATLSIDGGRIAAQGTLDARRVSARLDIADLPLSLAALVAGVPELGGTLTATATLDGTPAAPAASLDAHVDGVTARGIASGNQVELTGNVTANLADGRLRVDGEVGGFAETGLKLGAELPVRLSLDPFAATLPPDGTIDGTLAWRGEVATLWEVLPLDDHRLAGKADIAAQAGGTVADPTVTAKVNFTDGRYENLSIGTVIDQLNVTATVDSGRELDVTVSGTDGGVGTISGEGKVSLLPEKAFPADVSLDFNQATLMRRDDLTVAANGDLKLAGDMTALALTGRIETTRVEARIDETLPPSVVDLEVVEARKDAGEPAEEKTGNDSNLTLDLDLVIPGQAFVRGRGLESEWRGDLRITGSAAAPKIAGTMSFVRGQFSFSGKRFTLEGSTLTFDGTDEIDPLLNIRAAHETSDVTALILVTGRASDPQIELTSTPALPQDEVLSRVLFNKGAGALSPLETVQLAAAVAQLSGAGPSGAGILDKVRDTLGVDVLEVGTDDNTGAASLRAGRYLNDQTFVGVKQGAEAGSTGVVVEIEVLPNIVVDTEMDQSGANKSGIKWKKDY